MSADPKERRFKRLLEDVDNLPPEQREAIVEHLFKVGDDELDQKKQETEITPLSEYEAEAKVIAKNWGTVTGIKCGYPEIDTMTKGLDPGSLVILAGRTSQYKTMLALNMARNIALDGTPVLFVTLENTKPEIAGRLIKMTNEEEWDKIASIIAVQVKDELNWKSVDPLIENFVESYTNGVVFIDHLHYFSRNAQNQAEELGLVTKEFKKNAIRHKVPVILISHVRKALNPKENAKLPSMDDLRGSSLIAQDADIVLMVGRGETNKDNVVIEIQKNRNKGFDPDNAVTYLKKDPNGIRIY